MTTRRIKKFDQFVLEGYSFHSQENLFPLLEEDSKPESYRSIAFNLAEIFSLYGFFFAQKPGVLKSGAWQGMMSDLARITDPDKKWDKIVGLVEFLQDKVSSSQMAPTQRGEFGFRGQYDYGQETEGLPRAAGYLRTASKAALKNFSPEEKAKSMDILDRTLLSFKPFTLLEGLILEKEKSQIPTSVDLLRLADSIGSKLLRIYDELEVTKSVFPESSDKIETFINGTVIPAVDEIKNMIQNEIPKVGTEARVGYMKKLQSFDKKVNEISSSSQSLRSQMIKSFQVNYASKQYEKSAQEIIDKVKIGIRNQGLQNARWRKSGDVFAGTTDVRDPEYSGDAQASPQIKRKNIEDLRAKQRKQGQDLAKYLAKKYNN